MMNKKVFFFSGLIVLLLFIIFFFRPLKGAFRGLYKETTTLSQIVYVLPDNKILHFNFPPGAEKVRIIIRPVLQLSPGGDSVDIPHYVRFRLRYQLYGADDKLLETRIYHGRQAVTMANILISKARYGYHYKDRHALSARIINLPTISSVRKGYLTIQLLDKEKAISNLLVRVQFRRTVPKQKRRMAWKHLSKKLKSLYQKGNVYGSAYTTSSEKDIIVKENKH